jgi:hypothetical protein
MADPTKAETEAVFKVLKAQKANKVRCYLRPAQRSSDSYLPCPTCDVLTTLGVL